MIKLFERLNTKAQCIWAILMGRSVGYRLEIGCLLDNGEVDRSTLVINLEGPGVFCENGLASFKRYVVGGTILYGEEHNGFLKKDIKQ